PGRASRAQADKPIPPAMAPRPTASPTNARRVQSLAIGVLPIKDVVDPLRPMLLGRVDRVSPTDGEIDLPSTDSLRPYPLADASAFPSVGTERDPRPRP